MMIGRLYEESAHDRLSRDIQIRRRSLRVQSSLAILLAAGVAVLAYFVSLSWPSLIALGGGASAAALYSALIAWHILGARREARRLLRGAYVSSTEMLVPELESPLPLDAIEKVCWNPSLPYFVVAGKAAIRHRSRHVVIEKLNLVNAQAFKSALERFVLVVDAPETTVKDLWAELETS